MRLAIDVEANALENPTKIWVIVTKDIDTGAVNVYRNLTEDVRELESFKAIWDQHPTWIGHNVLGWDFPHLGRLLRLNLTDIDDRTIDTLVLSKLVDYPREGGHSIEDYGVEFGFEKLAFTDFSKLSEEMVTYCTRDVEISEKIFLKYRKVINDPRWKLAIRTEHQFQWRAINAMKNNGFAFDTKKCTKLLDKVTKELEVLDGEINKFPDRVVFLREVTPTLTKFGTFNRINFGFEKNGDLSKYNGGPFSRIEYQSFNPASVKQVVDLLWSAGWKPEDRTKTAVTVDREIPRADPSSLEGLLKKKEKFKKYGWKINEFNLNTLPTSAPPAARTIARRILVEARRRTLTEWLNLICTVIKIEKTNFGETGIVEQWTPTSHGEKEKAISQRKDIEVCQSNLEKKKDGENTSNILTDYRSKKLIEWLKSKKVNASFVKENVNFVWITVTGPGSYAACSAALATWPSVGMKQGEVKSTVTSTRIHGSFQGLGAWSHRMAHQKPNMANIPNSTDLAGRPRFLGAEMRALFIAPPKRLLVGVDAAAIQLRIFAHYIDDAAFTKSLVEGKKEDKSDPHSLNKTVIGRVCKSRAASKRYIFALLLGAGTSKLAEILECSNADADASLQKIMERYTGFTDLKQSIIPADAKRGWFYGLDGRKVRIPGNTANDRRHLAMSGYLQNGEAVVMKMATLFWIKYLEEEFAKPEWNWVNRNTVWMLVNLVHDEWQTECPNYMEVALKIAELQDKSLHDVGVMLHLKCPLAGSYRDEDRNDFTIGVNWRQTH